MPPQIRRVQQAGFVSRLAAFVLDVMIVTAGSIVFAALVSLILSFFGFSAQGLKADDPTRSLLVVLQFVIVALSGLAVVVFIPGYFVLFWVIVGATPGKQVLGLKIVRTSQQQQLGWGRAIVRFIGYWISAIVLFLGFLWVLVDGRRQAWHDKMADTFVVYTWDVPQDE
jgi:uncharacterized RDD family membrane protein YckC